jgi:hypothetical protein
MKIVARTASRKFLWWILASLTLLCASGTVLPAQSPSTPSATAPAPAPVQPPSDIRAVLNLNGPWRFQAGDDLEWAETAFDDSKCPTVTLGDSLALQGVGTYSGYAWYRLRLEPQQLAPLSGTSGALSLYVDSDSIGQLDVFINGLEVGHTRGMTEQPATYQSPPFAVTIPAAAAKGPLVIAVRTWAAGSGITVSRGLLAKIEIGPQADINDAVTAATGTQWNENAVAAIVLACIFLAVALLGAALYLSQRHHSEYLWLALLCAAAAAGRIERAAFGLAFLSYPAYWTLSEFTSYLFVAITIEFVYRFTGSQLRRAVRAAQIAALVAPFFHFIGIQSLEQVVSVSAEAMFCIVVTVLLFRAWRQGRGDAGVMLVPFFLAAISDWINTVLDYLVDLHWLPARFASPTFTLGPIRYTIGNVTDAVFLSSLIAVILYRFVRVSEIEQRSTAEIAAARSVQALLIPTQLPSTKNFMLESAYLPVNGVGGDFFQVLPLKDDSLLIVVGDVSGKGLQAAMNSSTLVGALRNELSHDPATVLEHLNHVLLGAVASPGQVPELDAAPCFATCLCARVYPDGTLAIANAGHLSPYRDGRELELPPGLPLGVIADSHYEQATFQLSRGDRLVFLSDGVVEATNSDGELFGFERTQQVSHEPARYIAQTAKHFGQTDDITVVSLYVSSRAAQRTAPVLQTH